MYIVILGATLRPRNYVSIRTVYRNRTFQFCEISNFILSVRSAYLIAAYLFTVSLIDRTI